MADNTGINLAPDQIEWLQGLPMSKRAAVVRDHILKHGAITTEELADDYGYGHPPRAARDLRDAGAGVITVMVANSNGRRMASYTFTGHANKNEAGRVVIPKRFADDLKEAYDHRCTVCSGVFAGRELQADHRIPFAIAGDKPEMDAADFQPLCASDNRAKSWSCEHCPNWTIRDADTCATCFWAHPEEYDHVATKPERRLSLTFQGSEVATFDTLRDQALVDGTTVEDLAKDRFLGR